MRIVLAVFGLLAAGALSASAQQQGDPYPWCAEYTGGGLGGSSNCYFMTIEQCRATVSGVGGYCSPNPFYTGPPVNQQQQNPSPYRQPRPRYF